MENSIAQVPEKFKVVEILGVILQSTAVLQELILIVEALSKKKKIMQQNVWSSVRNDP